MKTIFALILSLGFVTSARALPSMSFYEYQGNNFSGIDSNRTFSDDNFISTGPILRTQVKMISRGDVTNFVAVITGSHRGFEKSCKVLFSSVADAKAFVEMVRESSGNERLKCLDASTRPSPAGRTNDTVVPNETRL